MDSKQAVCQVKPKNAVSLMLAEVSSQFLISSLLSFKLDYKKKRRFGGWTDERTDGRRLALFFPSKRYIPSHQYNVFSESVMVVRARLISGRGVCIHVRWCCSLSSRKAIIIIG